MVIIGTFLIGISFANVSFDRCLTPAVSCGPQAMSHAPPKACAVGHQLQGIVRPGYPTTQLVASPLDALARGLAVGRGTDSLTFGELHAIHRGPRNNLFWARGYLILHTTRGSHAL